MTGTDDTPRTNRHGIVVGYDGSPAAERAVRWAAAEAVRRDTPLTVLYVVDFTGLAVDLFSAHVDDWPDPFVEAASKLTHEGVALATGSEPTVRARALVATGAPDDVLVQHSGTAELIVVGTRGRGEVAAACLGSVSAAVSTHAHCPVVIVRGDRLHAPGPGYPVVVGVDGSASCRHAVDVAADIAADARAPLRIVSAWTASSEEPWLASYPGGAIPSTPELVRSARAGADQAVQDAAGQARRRYPRLEVGVLAVQGRPPPALVEASNDASLIVVGTRGHGAFTSLVLGSVSHGVVHAARCPVAVVRTPKVPQDHREPAAPVHVMI